MKKLLLIALLITFISCKKEEVKPIIKVSVLSTNQLNYKRLKYAFTNDFKDDVFTGSKNFTYEITNKKHYFYFEYYSDGVLNDSMRIVGLKTDTIFLLTNKMKGQILIK